MKIIYRKENPTYAGFLVDKHTVTVICHVQMSEMSDISKSD